MNTLVKDKLSTNKDATSTKKYDIDLTKQKYDLEKKHIDELKQNNDDKVKEYESEVYNSNQTIQALHAEIANATGQVELYSADVALQTETESKVKKLGKLESQIESNLSKFQKDISFFQHNDDCPTCRQSIASEFKEGQIQSLQTKTTQCELGLKDLESKLLDEQAKLNKIAETQKTIQKLQINIATKNTSINEVNKYIVKIQKEILALKETKGSTQLQESQLQELASQLKQLESDLKELIEEKTYYEAATSLLRDTGIKTKIIKQYLPIINKLVNKYLSSLDFFVNFNLDESFKETIKSRHRDDFSYHNFSEGEKQRIDMALMLTWRAVAKLKNSSNTNLLILDETFDSSLDTTGTEELMKILHMLEGVNLFVISHKGDILQDKFLNVIRFGKEKNFSRILK
jgi:DNA repair exonuclease SbcCD ATPase subunit